MKIANFREVKEYIKQQMNTAKSQDLGQDYEHLEILLARSVNTLDRVKEHGTGWGWEIFFSLLSAIFLHLKPGLSDNSYPPLKIQHETLDNAKASVSGIDNLPQF